MASRPESLFKLAGAGAVGFSGLVLLGLAASGVMATALFPSLLMLSTLVVVLA